MPRKALPRASPGRPSYMVLHADGAPSAPTGLDTSTPRTGLGCAVVVWKGAVSGQGDDRGMAPGVAAVGRVREQRDLIVEAEPPIARDVDELIIIAAPHRAFQ